jgi:hypothetical protein
VTEITVNLNQKHQVITKVFTPTDVQVFKGVLKFKLKQLLFKKNLCIIWCKNFDNIKMHGMTVKIIKLLHSAVYYQNETPAMLLILKTSSS